MSKKNKVNMKKLNFEKKCESCGKLGILCKNLCPQCYQKIQNIKYKSKFSSLCKECKIIKVFCSEMCKSCYNKIRRIQRLEKCNKICIKCKKKGVTSKNMCENCYSYRNGPKKSDFNKSCEKCGNLGVWCKNRCRPCYTAKRQRKFLSDEVPVQSKAKDGQGTINPDGYRVITKKNHPNANKWGRMLEHTYVMSEHLKRSLHKHENVHHKNGIRNDNRIENLELWTKSHPVGSRVEDKIKWAKEFLGQYPDM